MNIKRWFVPADCFIVWIVQLVFFVTLICLAGHSLAAELTPVAGPPADWMGVGIVAGIAAISVAIVGYAFFIRRPGLQPGEETINKLLGMVEEKDKVIAAQAVVIATTAAAPAASDPVPVAAPFVNEKYMLTIPGDGSTPTVVRVQS